MPFLKDNILSREINRRWVLKSVAATVVTFVVVNALFVVFLFPVIYWQDAIHWDDIEGTYGIFISYALSLLVVMLLGFPGVLRLKNISKKAIRIRASIVFSLLGVFLLSAYIWHEAYLTELYISYTDYPLEYPELAAMDIRNAYNLAIKKIVLINGFFFASVFLLANVFKKK